MAFALWFLALGLLGALLEAALAGSVPAFALPNLALLFTLAATLVFAPARGMLLAFALGLGADMLSDTLFGQHAFVHLMLWALLRALETQIEFRSARTLVALGALMTLASALVLWLTSWFLLGAFAVTLGELGTWLLRALVAGACTPLVVNFARFLERVFSERRTRREMALNTRHRALS